MRSSNRRQSPARSSIVLIMVATGHWIGWWMIGKLGAQRVHPPWRSQPDAVVATVAVDLLDMAVLLQLPARPSITLGRGRSTPDHSICRPQCCQRSGPDDWFLKEEPHVSPAQSGRFSSGLPSPYPAPSADHRRGVQVSVVGSSRLNLIGPPSTN